MTAADRPSVTDNARAEAIEAAARWLDRLYPNGLIAKKSVLADLALWADRAKRGVHPSGREWAAARAETSTEQCEPRLSDHGQDKHCRSCGVEHRTETPTATVEDAEAAVVDALGQSPFAHHEVIPSGETASTLYVTYDDEWDELASLIVQMLASRGLLARPLPNRDQIARALIVAAEGEAGGRAWDAPGPHGRARWYVYADAVLALWPGRTEAEVRAEALEEAAAAWAEDPDQIGDSEADARNWLRDRADTLRAGGRRG